jgi:DinB superfamily
MPETIEQYTARILGLASDRDPWLVLAETPARLRSLVTGATAHELTWTTSPTRWSVGQIVAHLADAEIVGAWRFRSIVATDGVPLQAYDQNVWASTFRYEDADPLASVTLFEALRNSTLRILRAVDPVRLEHAGMHEERGRESVLHLMRLYAGHDVNHLTQIERLLNEARAAN